mgnify:CR=1 FL=1
MTHTFYFDDLYDYFFVFLRLSALLMFFPGIGETFIPARIRLLFAFVLTLIITPVIDIDAPTSDLLNTQTLIFIIRETFVGAFLGILAKLLLNALQVTGSIIGMQTSLSGAALLNPSLGTQDTAIGTILMFGATALMFATDCHYLLLAALVTSYETFPVLEPFIVGDVSQAIIQMISKSFWLGVKLSFPILIVGTLLNVCTGLVNRLMPQMQVYFMFTPVQIFLGFLLLVLTISTVVSIFIDHFREFLEGVANG